MSLVDELITASVSGVMGLFGVFVGSKLSQKSSHEASDRAIRHEHEVRRSALRHECELNLNMETEQPADELWSYETTVLHESSVHAGAFSPTVLQRIIWVRVANNKLEAKLTHLRSEP
jgi:hypothetical protein